MKFKKMEIYGFKSFADKVQVQFESGVTGIVGPNGCGKSNVADSIRWVLGEQSAKALRGSSMQDVIFNGTEKRKPQSFAEVSLYFDNTEKIFNVDYDEVVLSRKLYRSGESGYAINKVPCRLREVQELLRDSGLGRGSYSIIGQGRIDEILSAKPEDRRAVFEEAAGISKLKNRKIESLKKLGNTQENLTRINDILHELEIQLGPLASQAETAKKYLDLRERLKLLEVNNYIYQYDTSSSQKEAINNRLNGIIEEIDLKTREFDETVDEYNVTARQIDATDDTISALRDELLELTVGLEKQAGETKLLQEKIAMLKSRRDELSAIIERDSEIYNKSSEAYENEKREKDVKSLILDELIQNIGEIATELEALDGRISSSENKTEENTQKLVESLGKLGDIKAQISSLSAEIKLIQNRISEQQAKSLDVENKVASCRFLMDESCANIESLTRKKSEMHERQRTEKQENIKLAYRQAGLEEDIKDIIGEFRSSQSKLHLMQEMQKENEGYAASVKKLLQESQNNASIGGRFINVVAKLMNVPEEYESAIDMALGSAVQNIVTKNEDDAKAVIQYLKDNNMGRATFLPMTSVKPRRIADEHMHTIETLLGVRGIASRLISFDDEYTSVFDSLLGSTVIVENMDCAVYLAQITKYSFKIVTLDGDVINPAGTMSGGSKKVQAVSLIGREREIQELEQRLVELEAEKQNKERELEAVKAEQEEFANKTASIDEELKSIEIAYAKEVESQKSLNQQIEDLGKEKAEIESLTANLTANKSSLEERLEAFRKYEEDINEGGLDENSVKDPEIYLLKKKRSDINNELTELKVKKAGVESQIVSIEGNLLRLSDELEKANKEIRYNKVELQKCLTDLSELEGEFSSVVDKKDYDDNVAALQTTRGKLANFDLTKKELSQKLSVLSDQKLTLNGEIQRANDRKYKEENLLVKIDADIETMQERVWEEYGLTYATALEYKLENHDISSGMQESAKLKKQIQGLGHVNVNAIEMLTDVTSRFNDLSAQRDDLTSAENDLTKIIASLTAEMETKFKSEFDKINTNFQGVFRELFGGGRAELRLADPENPLECGIDIAAEPTGKKLQNITLLSGGERALTAIAILFAILKLKPMPFCVLDEIEAALDDANVERYAKYLKRFSNYTQFIVITHRKPTMELADTLYGVTMEERGVSKVVSVQLSEAIKNSAKEN